MALFSIVIPAYNRERFIGRAIRSCLNQSLDDFEVIIVDDGSTDRSVEMVQEFKDSRVRLIRHETNQERLIARNTGALAAKGEWIVWFDSDDELVPEALEVMKNRVEEVAPEVLGLTFRCRLLTGRISPDLPYCDEIWDYQQSIRWIEAHHNKWSEMLWVVHRSTIASILYPEDRFYTMELQYYLDFASQFQVRSCTDVLRIYHLDAENTTWNPKIGTMLKGSPIFAHRLERILSIHGEALRKWAPKTYDSVLCGMITQLLLSKQRRKAWEAFCQSLRSKHLSYRLWFIMALGMISPILLARVKVMFNIYIWAFKYDSNNA